MWILVLLGKIIVALPKPWIKSTGPDIVLTLDFPNDMLEKYFLSRRIVCYDTTCKACIYIRCRMMYQGMREIHVSSNINKEKNLNKKK